MSTSPPPFFSKEALPGRGAFRDTAIERAGFTGSKAGKYFGISVQETGGYRTWGTSPCCLVALTRETVAIRP